MTRRRGSTNCLSSLTFDSFPANIFIPSEHSREMVMKRKNEDEEELDVSKAAKLDPPPEEVKDISPTGSLVALCAFFLKLGFSMSLS